MLNCKKCTLRSVAFFCVTHVKNSRERGGGRCGSVFGGMIRSPLPSASNPGAQPSGTDSFRRTAGSGQGGATVRSHSVAAEGLGILIILERTAPTPSPAPLPASLLLTSKKTITPPSKSHPLSPSAPLANHPKAQGLPFFLLQSTRVRQIRRAALPDGL